MRTKTLWVRDEYLCQILDGRKTIEVRVAYSNLTSLKIGDVLRLNEQYPFKIQRVGKYADFNALLANECAAKIAPDLKTDELLETLRQIYPTEKEILGVLAFEIAPIAR